MKQGGRIAGVTALALFVLGSEWPAPPAEAGRSLGRRPPLPEASRPTSRSRPPTLRVAARSGASGFSRRVLLRSTAWSWIRSSGSRIWVVDPPTAGSGSTLIQIHAATKTDVFKVDGDVVTVPCECDWDVGRLYTWPADPVTTKNASPASTPTRSAWPSSREPRRQRPNHAEADPKTHAEGDPKPDDRSDDRARPETDPRPTLTPRRPHR
jgi:hypothetical protein